MKPTILKSLCAAFALFTMLFTSCSDDFPFPNGDIPEGEGTLSATVTFHPASGINLGGTRTPGNAIKDINSLCVLVYHTDGALMHKYAKSDLLNYKSETYTVKPDDHLDGNDAQAEEVETAQASFTLPDHLPYGTYKIYAVANMGDMSAYTEDIKTEEGLKRISLDWNAGNIPSNDQMFGYFTPATNMNQEGFDAPPIVFKQPDTKIHAWLKRLASKVTVAYDPSGLKEGVYIYVKSVTLMDIPKTCLLGEENRPNNTDQLYNHVDSYEKPYQWEPTIANDEVTPNTRFWYNSAGLVTDVNNAPDLNDKTSGLVLTKSVRDAIPKGAHAADAQSLFFFENNQTPDYEGMTKDQRTKYDKCQQNSKDDDGNPIPDGVGTPIRDDDGTNDFKDRVKYGTYIEVEAYYVSNNPDKIGEGPIKYRFMLGKDIIDNYDAQRNYHFKLTLGFRGWANEPDWHIDYEDPDPGIEVPEVFRVSYLYNQSSELPIRIRGNCTNLKVEIIENNWAPYDPTSSDSVPPQIIPSDPVRYQFQWNREAYESDVYMQDWNKDGVIEQVPYFGFLSLHLPNRNTTSVNTAFSQDANNELIGYYNTNKEGLRVFDTSGLTIGEHQYSNSSRDPDITDEKASDDDIYNVKYVMDDKGKPMPNQKTLMLPLWTRAKTLILDSGFSGNNPYEAFERKARLRITGTFPVITEDGKEDIITIPKEVTVFQVKRIVNPKGVWRSYDKSDAFNVTLLEADNANGKSGFHPFLSEGEWTAFIDVESSDGAGFTIGKNSETNGYEEGGRVHGYTGSKICFKINFDTQVDENDSKCAVVKVLYHGNQCMHKILIRKGYNNPITLGDRKWSSFSLYSATKITGTSNDYNVTLTKNPLMLGSMFKRGNLTQGIPVRNNETIGPFVAPDGYEFILTDGTRKSWGDITYSTATSNSLGSFRVGTQRYRVPSYDDFMALTDACEYGFGVFYGSAATSPQTTADEAYGLIDPENEGLFDDPKGMRGVVAYSRETGDQIFFPMGKFGTGRRQGLFIPGGTTGIYAGQLRYGDVYNVLADAPTNKNVYRPIPYNLPIACGNIYWIDQARAGGGPSNTTCLGWDMNYFNFDFNPYTNNNRFDACPIKFVVVESNEP